QRHRDGVWLSSRRIPAIRLFPGLTMNTTTANDPVIEIRQRLALALGAAILAAGLILVMFVLPAEFAVDPLGTGAKLGLLPLGVVGQQVAALNKTTATGAAAGQGAILVAQD